MSTAKNTVANSAGNTARTDQTRVVITGMGVVAANGTGCAEFADALFAGRSGITFQQRMQDAKLGCQIAGVPADTDALCDQTFAPDELLAMNRNQRYAALAAVEAWESAGLTRPDANSAEPDWDTGGILGTGIGGMDTIGSKVVPLTDAGKSRRLGSTTVEQVMASATSARVGGLLALGNKVSSNSSACSTGTEAIIDGMERIRAGLAKRMLCGGSEGDSEYTWAGFDAMRVMARGHNDDPEAGSRPLSASAGGFVPGAGAGMVMLESLESAQERGAPILTELLGGHLNCGGHRAGGSMTAPNPQSVERCIRAALADAGIDADDVDALNCHLTATGADSKEISAWAAALERDPADFPKITATKSMIGHGLGAAGALETVASILMLQQQRLHPCINSDDVHPDIQPWSNAINRAADKESTSMPGLNIVAKSSFGFGDVNAVLILRRWSE